MTDIATPQYARALLANTAMRMIELLAIVAADEKDAIVHHRLGEVANECEWVAKNYGDLSEGNADDAGKTARLDHQQGVNK